MKKSINYFKYLSLATSALFIYLFYQLFMTPESFIMGLGLQPSEAASILARRASMFMLGISVLMFGSRNLFHSDARQIICIATGITMLGLACMGSYEFIRGTVNSSILIAITIETIIGVTFMLIFFKNKKLKHRNN